MAKVGGKYVTPVAQLTRKTAIFNLLQRNSWEIDFSKKLNYIFRQKRNPCSLQISSTKIQLIAANISYPWLAIHLKILISVNLTKTVSVNLLRDVPKKIVKVLCVKHMKDNNEKIFVVPYAGKKIEIPTLFHQMSWKRFMMKMIHRTMRILTYIAKIPATRRSSY